MRFKAGTIKIIKIGQNGLFDIDRVKFYRTFLVVRFDFEGVGFSGGCGKHELGTTWAYAQWTGKQNGRICRFALRSLRTRSLACLSLLDRSVPEVGCAANTDTQLKLTLIATYFKDNFS